MKPFFTRELRPKVIAAIIVVIVGISYAVFIVRFQDIYAFFLKVLSILTPFAVGLVLAFLLLPIQNGIERLIRPALCRRGPRNALCRILALTTAYILFFALLSAVFAVVLPALIDSIRALVNTAPGYIRVMTEAVRQWAGEYDITNEYLQSIFGSWESILLQAVSYVGSQVPNLISLSANISSGITSFLIGCIISFYMLYGKERFAAQAKKGLCAFMPRERVDMLVMWARRTHDIFSRYVGGTIITSFLMGFLCYAGMLIFKMEYAMLISVVVGVTNIIPVFGPFVGAATGCVILLFINPLNALGFAVFILVVQQIEGNIIAPRILGGSIGISPFWVMLAIVLGGGLFGFAGMLVSIPVFALLYAIAQTVIESRLKKRGLSPNTADYMAHNIPSCGEVEATWLSIWGGRIKSARRRMRASPGEGPGAGRGG